MSFKLKQTDRKYLIHTLREMNSLTLAPSNISDIYDMNLIRSRIGSNNGTVKVFLDNNVLTRVINLPVEGKGNYRQLTDEEKKVCCLMGYFSYCGIIVIPNIAMYESQSTPSPDSRIDADVIFRYFDHIPAKIYLDLACERIDKVPHAEWLSAMQEVDNNAVTQADINSNSYDGEINSRKAFALNLMKAWIIYKQGNNFERNLEDLMDWIFENSISDQNSLLYFTFLMSGDRLGSMLKKINSTDPSIVLKNINNAAWDLTHLNIFLMSANKFYVEAVFAFCSRDKLCHELLAISIENSSEEKFSDYLRKHYTKKQRDLIIGLRDRHNNRPNREEHIKKVEDTLDGTIASMSTQINDYLAI